MASAVQIPVKPHVRANRALSTVSDYIALTKPRIIELLLVTTVPVMMLAARGWPSSTLLAATLIGGTLAAGAANALNCFVDRDIDALMRRTARRPLIRAVIPPRHALWFGLGLAVVSVAELWFTANALSALMALSAIAFYVLVYTMVLKRRTSANIVWGGAAGCMPVLIGWSAVTGSLSWPPVILFGVVFLWTPPHFWALAMQFRDDYAAAGVPMLPVVASPGFVAGRIVAYSWAMVAASLALWPIGHMTAFYPAAAVVLGALFLREAYALRSRVRAGVAVRPTRVFHASIQYLTLLFTAVAVDALLERLF
ncbi:MAG: heme o synthase [Frankiales bacterium]|nr:heme o synthase [Frankiales bacterium]